MSILLAAVGGSAAAGAADTLTLNALSSTRAVTDSTAVAGVHVQRDGYVDELVNGVSWVAQNGGTEWIDNNASDIGDDYEVKLTKSSGTDPAGPTLGSWHTISTTREWTLTQTTWGVKTFSGTMEIREIADTGNSVSASVTITANNIPPF